MVHDRSYYLKRMDWVRHSPGEYTVEGFRVWRVGNGWRVEGSTFFHDTMTDALAWLYRNLTS